MTLKNYIEVAELLRDCRTDLLDDNGDDEAYSESKSKE